MNQYEKLLEVFDDVLKESKDYHIAHVYHVGYVSLIGLRQYPDSGDISVIVDEIFSSPDKMAESILKNWRWQWFYKNREYIGARDYADIRELDKDVPDKLREEYLRELKEMQHKADNVLNNHM